jgi:hypothetical protein
MEVLSPHAIVEIENRRFDSWLGLDLLTASVDLTTDKTGEGSVELFDPDFKILDAFLGNGIRSLVARFWFGWTQNLGNSLFVGQLARVEWNEKVTTFRFHDYSAKMKQTKKARNHKKKTDLQILKDLAQENGLRFVAPKTLPPSEPLDTIIQSGKTDWEFALKIAEKAGLRLYVRDDTLFAVEAGTTALQPAAASLQYGADFTMLRGFGLSYKLPENKKGRPRKTEVRGRGKGGKRLTGQAEVGTSGTTDIVVKEDLLKHTVSLANRRASGKRDRRREYAFEHSIKTLHSFRQIVDVRNTITLGGMGGFFSGNYVVTDVRHQFRAGSLTSEMTVGRDALK